MLLDQGASFGRTHNGWVETTLPLDWNVRRNANHLTHWNLLDSDSNTQWTFEMDEVNVNFRNGLRLSSNKRQSIIPNKNT